MPEKFIVPQFIDSEDKILGPITVRQFLICLVATGILFVEYMIFKRRIGIFILLALPTGGIAAVFAFLKIYGQPFHVVFVNFLQTRTRPFLRVWDKTLTDNEVRVYLARKEEAPAIVTATKPRPESTRLRDLALTVNTGGVYNPEEGD